jgi:hypothetical protein
MDLTCGNYFKNYKIQLTLCRTVLHEKLMVTHLVKKFPAFHETERFNNPSSWGLGERIIPHNRRGMFSLYLQGLLQRRK